MFQNNMTSRNFPAYAPYSFYPATQAYFNDPVPQYTPRQQQVAAPIVPTDTDVLMGRGGKNNMHIGNEKLRQMARAKVNEYKKACKKGKSHMSLELVAQVHALSPAGRFLRRDATTSEWHVVADELAREKASQCLRDAVADIKKSRRSSSSSEPLKKQKMQTNKRLIVRKETPVTIDMEPLQEQDDDTVSSVFTIPADVIAALLENTSTTFDEVATMVSDETQRNFGASFDCDSWLTDEDLLLAPLIEIGDFCPIQ
jgi:hypothetical protein